MKVDTFSKFTYEKKGVKWVKRGGTIDLTCGDETPEACVFIKENGGDISRITISSDAYGTETEVIACRLT